MKKVISLMLVIVLSFSLCACGKSEPKLSGKYYSEEIDDVYYEFDGDSICYLVAEPLNARTEYRYVINEQDAVDNCFVVHITDVSSSSVQKLVYDANNDRVYDQQFGHFSKK